MPVQRLTAPPRFRALRRDLPITCYRRNMPHWRQDGATYFVTFRLLGSLPQSRLEEIRLIRRVWDEKHPPPRSDEELRQLTHLIGRKVEYWLDQGMGSCLLCDPDLVAVVVESLHHFDRERYHLFAYVVMPNHIHAILRPLLCQTHPLEKCLQGRKLHMSLEINKKRGGEGSLWQEESFDRLIRDVEHLSKAVKYIGDNPRKARLEEGEYALWLAPDWIEAGWSFGMS